MAARAALDRAATALVAFRWRGCRGAGPRSRAIVGPCPRRVATAARAALDRAATVLAVPLTWAPGVGALCRVIVRPCPRRVAMAARAALDRAATALTASR
ncbi:hypothetical protein GCM10010397_60780 [Streptomyces spinoverrucosus]|nr:hypothetical protein GCM10010397_60780 [Streptomyces spinoverrucosus]